jgi:hypothetical protein
MAVFGVLNVPAGDLSAKKAIRAAGCTHTVVQAQWTSLQPSGPGTALNSTAVAALNTEYDQAASAGLNVMLEVALHYPPAWVAEHVEQFKDQAAHVYEASAKGPGLQVSNWVWTALGWEYVSDLCNKLGVALGSSRINQTTAIKIGGGFYGELHYPLSATASPTFSHWGYGASMQSGTGLASGQTVCPHPGYTIYSGTDAEDSIWLNWYLNGLGKWLMFFIGAMRTAGWSCDFQVAHPGYGIRANYTHSQAQFRESAGAGEDPVRMIGAYSHDPKIWPYCTWMNTADGWDPVTADSDISAWKKIYNEAVLRNKHFRLWGENTGGENAAGLADIFSGDANGSALSTASWSRRVASGRYQGIFWLQYSSLISGSGSDAQLSDYATAIITR